VLPCLFLAIQDAFRKGELHTYTYTSSLSTLKHSTLGCRCARWNTPVVSRNTRDLGSLASSLPQLLVIDARHHMLGRMCSIIAKELLKGQKVVIVRAEEANISGSLFRNEGCPSLPLPITDETRTHTGRRERSS
jgi:hypothetical protein